MKRSSKIGFDSVPFGGQEGTREALFSTGRLGGLRSVRRVLLLEQRPRQFVEIRSESFYVRHAARRDPATMRTQYPCAHNATSYPPASFPNRFFDDSSRHRPRMRKNCSLYRNREGSRYRDAPTPRDPFVSRVRIVSRLERVNWAIYRCWCWRFFRGKWRIHAS